MRAAVLTLVVSLAACQGPGRSPAPAARSAATPVDARPALRASEPYTDAAMRGAIADGDASKVAALLTTQPAARGAAEGLAGRMLMHGADVNAKDREGQTPLHRAAERGSTQTIAWLLAHGAAIEGRDADGRTPLHIAVREDRVEAVATLLRSGAVVDARETKGMTPLHLAAGNRRTRHMEVFGVPELGMPPTSRILPPDGPPGAALALLSAGASVLEVDASGNTALHHAASRGVEDVASLLLKRGGRRSARNREGKRPIDLARANGHAAVVSLLSSP